MSEPSSQSAFELTAASQEEPRFGGVERLYASEGFQRIRAAHVVVVGIGGVGSWTVEALARSGVGALTLVDLDDICATNTNRQIHAHSRSLGQLKVEAMADRARSIHPECRIHTRPEFITEKNLEWIQPDTFTLVVDAIDSIRAKCALTQHCLANQIRFVAAGAAGGRRDASRIQIARFDQVTRDPLLRAVRKRLRKADPNLDMSPALAVFSNEIATPPNVNDCAARQSLRITCETGYGTAAHVTGSFGLAAAGAALELIVQGN